MTTFKPLSNVSAAARDRWDVIIVGGGVIGCSVAYYLARQGARVLVIERDALGLGASAANPGSIALSSKVPGQSLNLAMASRVLYERLSDELGADLEFAVDGNLFFARTEAELAFLSDLACRQRDAGVPVTLIDADACRRLNNLLEGPLAGGVHCPVDAHTNPFLVTAAFAEAARRHGAVFRTGVEVKGITRAGAGFQVSCEGSPIGCDMLVNCAGLAAPRIGAMLGLAHEVVPRAGHVMVFEATPDLPLIKTSAASQLMAKHVGGDGKGIGLSYNRKPRSGTLLLGGSNDMGNASKELQPEVVTGICAYAIACMPALARMNIIRAWVGLRPYSPGGPVLGLHDLTEPYLCAFGHGGDGMALAPVTGLYIAEQVARYPKHLPLDGFLASISGASQLANLQGKAS